MAVDDGGERSGQISQRIDGIELAGLDQRRDDRPVLGSGIMARKECILPVERNGLDATGTKTLMAAVGQGFGRMTWRYSAAFKRRQRKAHTYLSGLVN